MDGLTRAEKFREIQRAFQQIFPEWQEIPAMGSPLCTFYNWFMTQLTQGSLRTQPDFMRDPRLPDYFPSMLLPVAIFEQALRCEVSRRLQQAEQRREEAQQQLQQQHLQAQPPTAPLQQLPRPSLQVCYLPCLVEVRPVAVLDLPPPFGFTNHQQAPRPAMARPAAPRQFAPRKPMRKILPQRRQ